MMSSPLFERHQQQLVPLRALAERRDERPQWHRGREQRLFHEWIDPQCHAGETQVRVRVLARELGYRLRGCLDAPVGHQE